MIQEGELVQEVWSIKKIIIGVVSIATVVGGGYAAKEFIFDKQKQPKPASVQESSKGTVEGAQTGQVEVEKVKKTVQEKINDIKDQVINLNAQEVASSSPQIQKVIDDIKGLEKYPKDQAKNMCQQICNGL